jgi:hypothetical protein
MRTSPLSLLLLGAAIVATTACDSTPIAYGDANSIIAVMEPELWERVDDDVYDALEPTIQTVRDEKAFTVTYQEPGDENWGNLRRFRQMLLVGSGDEEWMQQALEEARDSVTGPGLYRAYDVWARGQQATIVLAAEGQEAEALRRHLPEINRTLDRQYREWSRSRMFLTGADTALADTLQREAGFRLLLPEVYRWIQRDSLYVFRNDNPDPSELIRQIAVTWKSPIPPDMQPEGLLEWREEVNERLEEPQVANLDDVAAGPLEYRGRQAYEIQAVWENPPERNWPAAGPFILRSVICPQQNRMYLLDAWLYAPGREKYEYMIQLETILDSFRCGRS